MVTQKNEKMAVVSIPIRPKKKYNPGYLLIPFLTYYLAKQTGRESVMAYNMRVYKEEADTLDLDKFIIDTKEIKINPNHVWVDIDPEHVEQISLIFDELVSKGHIQKKKASVVRCDCRRVEMLEESENWSLKRKLYTEEGCKICESKLEVHKEEVYVLSIPSCAPSFKVVPDFTAIEMQEMAQHFSRKEILISRTRDSALEIQTKNGLVKVDPDFAWQVYLIILRRNGIVPEFVIGSQKNLLAMYLSGIIYEFFYEEPLTFLIPAYTLFKDGEQKEYLVESLDEAKSKIVPFLLSHITFKKKQNIFDARLLESIGPDTLKKFNKCAIKKNLDSVSKIVEFLNEKGFRRIIDPETFKNDNKYEKIRKNMGDNSLFVAGCVAAFNNESENNLVCIQQIGSGKRRDTTPYSDLDYVVVVRDIDIDHMKTLRDFIKSLDFFVDCSILALKEIEEGGRFRLGTHGSYQLALILSDSKTLYGENVFATMRQPNKQEIRASVQEKISEYTWWARRMYVESNRERDIALNYKLNSRMIKMMRDILYFKNGLGMREHRAQLIDNFITAFSNKFSDEEVLVLTKLKGVKDVVRTTSNMSEQYLDVCMSIINKIFVLSKDMRKKTHSVLEKA